MITGSIVALVTPMNEQGEIDWQSLNSLIEMQVASGTQAIVSMGTTGESATLDVDEHCQVIKHTIDVVNKRIPVIAGTGANSTSEAIELTAKAKKLGADACLLVAPYYNKPTQEGLFQHYQKISNEVAIPQFLYNVPGRTACDIQNETVERLAACEHIVGIKDATGDMYRGQDLIDRVGDKLQILSGDDATFLEYMKLGAKGNISVTANIAPAAINDVCVAALAGEFEKASEINAKLEGLHQDLFCQSNPIPAKWALAQMGLIRAGIRLPLTELTPKYHERVLAAMKRAGVIE